MAKFSKGHYQEIAKAIWQSGAIADKNAIREQAKKEVLRLLAGNLSGLFKNDNDKFDEARFMAACGIRN